MKDVCKIFIPALIAVVMFVGIFAALRFHQWNCDPCFSFKAFTPEVVKHFIQGFGPLGLVVFIFLYMVNTISLLPPIGIMSLTSGFVFGPFWGSIALMVGSFLGTSATFLISRFFGGRLVQKILKGKGQEFQEKLNRNGFKVILFIRLIPLIPWEVVNYISGLSQIKYRDYILGTLIGIFPSVVIQSYFADRLAHFNWRDPTLLVAIGAFFLLLIVPAVYLRMKKRTVDQ